MAMPKWLDELLSDETFKDKTRKVDDKDVPIKDLIADWYDKAEAKDKVQKANEDISKERDELKAQLKKQKEDFEKSTGDKDAEIKRLLTNQLSDEDKAKMESVKKDGMTPEAEARYNKLVESVNELKGQLDDQNKKLETEREAAKRAVIEKAKTDLRASLSQALGNVDITGDRARIAINDIISEGMAKSNLDEQGVVTTQYVYYKDGKAIDAESADGLASYYASVNEHLVSASGKTGPGKNHNGGNNGSTGFSGKESQHDLLAQAAAMMDGAAS